MLPLFFTIAFVYSETSYVPSALMKQQERKRREGNKASLKRKSVVQNKELWHSWSCGPQLFLDSQCSDIILRTVL